MKTISLVGSTGSIGTQAAEVICAEADRYKVVAIGSSTSVDKLAAQAALLHPSYVAIASSGLAAELRERVPPNTEVIDGPGAMAEIASMADVVVNGVVGFAGLPVTLSALQAGCRLALANKESLIAGGPVVQRARRTAGAEIIPVDSEHGAIHQCLRAICSPEEMAAMPVPGAIPLERVVLTASGGPFRGRRLQDLAEVTVEEALEHPTWTMGPKITIDSSTLMNKGLEVIEAHELFGIGYDRIEVLVHPQSVVHSMIEVSDGSTLAQLSQPDMRLPIAYALAYPQRGTTRYGAIDWGRVGRLDFEAADRDAFRCLDLAYAAGRSGGTSPAVLNGANEVAVEAFLHRRIRWPDIASVLATVLDDHVPAEPSSVADVLAADQVGRDLALEALRSRSGLG